MIYFALKKSVCVCVCEREREREREKREMEAFLLGYALVHWYFYCK